MNYKFRGEKLLNKCSSPLCGFYLSQVLPGWLGYTLQLLPRMRLNHWTWNTGKITSGELGGTKSYV
jgi:hypothetical protein